MIRMDYNRTGFEAHHLTPSNMETGSGQQQTQDKTRHRIPPNCSQKSLMFMGEVPVNPLISLLLLFCL